MIPGNTARIRGRAAPPSRRRHLIYSKLSEMREPVYTIAIIQFDLTVEKGLRNKILRRARAALY